MVDITGSLNNLQSSVDFYISTTSKNIIADSKEMRKKFFDIFKSEDSYREENFLLFQERVTDDYSIVSNANPVLVNGEECYSLISHSFAKGVSVDEEYPDDMEVYIADSPPYRSSTVLDTEETSLETKKNSLDLKVTYLENEETDLENENLSAYSIGSMLENEKADSETKKNIFEYRVRCLENEGTRLENENIVVEKGKFEDSISLEEDKANLENENMELEDGDEFINHSSSKEENIELEEENLNPFSSININNFTGSKEENLELEEDKVYSENENMELEDGDEFINHSSSKEENLELEDEDIELKEENSNPFSSININNFTGSKEETSSCGESGGVVDESFPWGTPNEDISTFNSHSNIDEVLKERQNIVVGVKIAEEEVTEVPKDLRDFVRLHHNCEMSFVLKYFTKKEIDKQLSLGRVFKRKNRLLI